MQPRQQQHDDHDDDAGAGPAQRKGDASAATETRQGLSDRSMIARR
jgi:hypothetical protein